MSKANSSKTVLNAAHYRVQSHKTTPLIPFIGHGMSAKSPVICPMGLALLPSAAILVPSLDLRRTSSLQTMLAKQMQHFM